MTTVRFVDELPPQIGRNRTNYTDIVDVLTNNPGKWGIVKTSAGKGILYYLRRTFPYHEWAQRTNVDANGQTIRTIYGRAPQS